MLKIASLFYNNKIILINNLNLQELVRLALILLVLKALIFSPFYTSTFKPFLFSCFSV